MAFCRTRRNFQGTILAGPPRQTLQCQDGNDESDGFCDPAESSRLDNPNAHSYNNAKDHDRHGRKSFLPRSKFLAMLRYGTALIHLRNRILPEPY